MRKFLFLGFILICGVCFGQQSDQFSYVGTSNDNVKYYLSFHKKDSIRGINDVWIKGIHPSKTIKNKSGKYVKVKGVTELILQRFFCEGKKILTLAYTKYDNKGNSTFSEQYSEYGEEKYIVPGSMGYVYYEFVCNNVIEVDPDAPAE